jgi:hypothetical protein
LCGECLRSSQLFGVHVKRTGGKETDIFNVSNNVGEGLKRGRHFFMIDIRGGRDAHGEMEVAILAPGKNDAAELLAFQGQVNGPLDHVQIKCSAESESIQGVK